jgi:hypothetical protein
VSPFTVEQIDGASVVVCVEGPTEGPDAERLVELVREHAGARRLIVDLEHCPLLNSKLLDGLVRVAAEVDCGLAVVTGTGYVRHMLEIGASGGVLLVATTREEALEALPA